MFLPANGACSLKTDSLSVDVRTQDSSECLPLLWAQANMWRTMIALGDQASYLNFRSSFALTHDVPLRTALEAIRTITATSDVSRTSFDEARAEQVIRSEVSVRVDVTDLAVDQTGTLEELANGLEAIPFALSDYAPIRYGLVVRGNQVKAVTTVHSHLAYDLHSIKPLTRDLQRALNGSPIAPLQTRDVASYERSDRARQRSAAVLINWEENLRPLEPGIGLRRMEAGDFTEWELRSRAVARSAQLVAASSAVSTSSVILAAFTWALQSTLSAPPSALLLISNNRQHSEVADYPGISAQNALYVIPQERDRSAPSLAESARRAYRESLRAYSRARYDSFRWVEMLSEATDAGTAPDLSFYFNDARSTQEWDVTRHPASHSGTDPEVRELGHRSYGDASLFMNLIDDGPNARILMTADNARISASQSVAILEGMFDIITRAAVRHQPLSIG